MTDEFENPIDKIIREAQSKGAFKDLPGKGKPIQWEDDSHVPEDQRMAQRIIKNAGFTLDWIELGRELDAAYANARERIDAARSAYAAGQLDRAAWVAAAREYAGQIRQINKQIIGYNLRVPGEQFQRRPYPIDPDVKDAIS